MRFSEASGSRLPRRKKRKNAPELTQEEKHELAEKKQIFESACQALDRDIGAGEHQSTLGAI